MLSAKRDREILEEARRITVGLPDDWTAAECIEEIELRGLDIPHWRIKKWRSGRRKRGQNLPRYTDATKESAIKMKAAGVSYQEIREKTGVCESTLREWMKARGVPIKRSTENLGCHRKKATPQILAYAQDVRDDYVSVNKIPSMILERFGVQLSVSWVKTNTTSPRSGKQYAAQRLDPKSIKRIRNMKAAGRSAKEIALRVPCGITTVYKYTSGTRTRYRGKT